MGKTNTYITRVIVLFLAVLFAVKYGGPALLRMYIEIGTGDCRRIPLLCIAPQREIINPVINQNDVTESLPYRFPEMEIRAPKGFTVINEEIKRVYYKRKPRAKQDAVIYLLYEKPGFFISLFPRFCGKDIKNNYDFIKRTMSARTGTIQNINDTFFVIIKSIFIPDLGDQRTMKMVEFSGAERSGFINYNLTPNGNYFDCNIIDRRQNFFKVYIKDKQMLLGFNQAMAIALTAQALN